MLSKHISKHEWNSKWILKLALNNGQTLFIGTKYITLIY